MNFENSVRKLIETLVEQTLSDRINWITKNSNSVTTEFEDIQIDFTVTWKLELKNGWTMSNGWLTIKSTDFDFTVYSHDFPDLISRMRTYLCDLFFSKNKPSEQDAIDKVNKITKKISLEEYRDNKINDILE